MIERTAPAKINLGLAVVGRREDGYHELESVVLRIGWSDRLTVRATGDDGHETLTVDGPVDCPVEGNLVLRAAALARGVAGAQRASLAFTLEKHIPMGAGMGGGSSDAATALRLAAEAWDVEIPLDRATVARKVGADVPFFMADAPAALMSGIGERVEPLPGPRSDLGVLLITPRSRIDTTAVYHAFDLLPGPSGSAAASVNALAEQLRTGLDGSDLAETWTERLRDANDLWQAALQVSPSLASVRADVEGILQRPTLLSGSGPTLVALYPSLTAAAQAGRLLTGERRPWIDGAVMSATDTTHSEPRWRFP